MLGLKINLQSHKKEGSNSLAYIRSDGRNISRPEIKAWSRLTRHEDWETFDHYIDCELETHRVYFTDESYAPDFTCTCSHFFKNYVCLHSIGIAACVDKYTLPDEAATGGLGVKRGPGRPKRVSKALKRN